MLEKFPKILQLYKREIYQTYDNNEGKINWIKIPGLKLLGWKITKRFTCGEGWGYLFSSHEEGTQSPSQSLLENGRKTERLTFERSKMQVLSLLLTSVAFQFCLSLGEEGNYNEAEWLNPYDMIQYDAAAQSIDNTVSLLLISLPCQTSS